MVSKYAIWKLYRYSYPIVYRRFLFITLALEISGLEKENVRNHVNLDLKINKLQKELEELVNDKS